jgi:hypothetical protein
VTEREKRRKESIYIERDRKEKEKVRSR